MTMMRASCVLMLAIYWAPVQDGRAALFSQDFSSSSVVSDYVNASSPNSGQWNAIGSSGSGVTVAIAGGALQYTRATANTGSFSRTTDFSPVPPALIYQFTLSVSGNSAAQTTAAVWQLGSGFGTANSAEANANVHSRFALNFTTSDGTFQLRDIAGGVNSGNLSGAQNITWVVNNSGGAISYVGPDSQSWTVADDAWDLWAGNSLLFDDIAAQTATQVLTDMKFAFTAGSGSVNMDNFVITAIPEPADWGLISAGGLMLVAGVHSRRQNRRAKAGAPS